MRAPAVLTVPAPMSSAITGSRPPLALQQQFARIVQDVERIRERRVASGMEIEGLCEGLMARAFGGELVA